MAVIVEYGGRTPQVASEAYLAPTATLIGDVTVGPGASIWFGAVLRADIGAIRIGARTSIQDNAVLHCTHELATIVEDAVTVGHGAVLEGCRLQTGCLVGMRAVVLHRATVGAGAMVAAGSVVLEGTSVPAGWLVAGVPATERKPLDADGQQMTRVAADEYTKIVAGFRRAPGATAA